MLNLVVNRESLVKYLRNFIPKTLLNWQTNNKRNFVKEHQENKSLFLEQNNFAIRNKRPTMEDRMAIYEDLNMFFEDLNKNYSFLNKPHALFAIFDGHSGIEAPEYVSSHLPLFIIQHELYETDIKKAIYDSFEKINKSLLMKANAEVNTYEGCF